MTPEANLAAARGMITQVLRDINRKMVAKSTYQTLDDAMGLIVEARDSIAWEVRRAERDRAGKPMEVRGEGDHRLNGPDAG